MTLANRLRLLTGVVMLCIMLLSGLLMHQMERVFEHANYGNTDSVSSLAILDKLQEGFLIVRILG